MKTLMPSRKRAVLRRRLSFAMVAAVVVAFVGQQSAPSETAEAEASNELYILNLTPPGISVVDTEHWKLASNISLDEDYEPYSGVVSPDGRFLYVAGKLTFRVDRREPLDPGKLWVVDLAARKVLRKIAVDTWAELQYVKNGDYLEVRDANRDHLYLDTRTNQLAAKFLGSPSLRRFRLNREASKVFALYGVTNLTSWDPKLARSSPPVSLRILSLDSGKPLTEIELPGSRGWAAGRCCDLMLSHDEKWLYIVDGGLTLVPRLYKSGTVYLVDVVEGKLVTQFPIPASCREVQEPKSGSPLILSVSGPKDTQGKLYQFNGAQQPQVTEVGADPWDMRRLPNQAGFWVISHQDMRFLADGASTFSYVVPLNRHKNTQPSTGATVFLDDYPSDVLYLPTQNRLVLGGMKKSDKLALVSLTPSRIERIVTVGRTGIKVRNASEEGFGIFLGYQPEWHQWHPGALAIASRPDGKFVYGFHKDTSDVTVMRADDGTILEKIPVEGVVMGGTSNGRLIYTYGLHGITWIDTQTNKKLLDHHPDSGQVSGMQEIKDGSHVLTLTSNSVLVWDAANGHLFTTIGGLHEPAFLVEHSLVVQTSTKEDLVNPKNEYFGYSFGCPAERR